MYETPLAKIISEVTDLSDAELKREYLSLKRKVRMNRMTDEDTIRFDLVEAQFRLRKEENV